MSSQKEKRTNANGYSQASSQKKEDSFFARLFALLKTDWFFFFKQNQSQPTTNIIPDDLEDPQNQKNKPEQLSEEQKTERRQLFIDMLTRFQEEMGILFRNVGDVVAGIVEVVKEHTSDSQEAADAQEYGGILGILAGIFVPISIYIIDKVRPIGPRFYDLFSKKSQAGKSSQESRPWYSRVFSVVRARFFPNPESVQQTKDNGCSSNSENQQKKEIEIENHDNQTSKDSTAGFPKFDRKPDPWYRRFKTAWALGNDIGDLIANFIPPIHFLGGHAGQKVISVVLGAAIGLVFAVVVTVFVPSSFDQRIQDFQKYLQCGSESWSKYGKTGLVWGSSAGAFIGGMLGTLVFPGLGTMAGAALGGLIGGIIGFVGAIATVYIGNKIREKRNETAFNAKTEASKLYRTNYIRAGITWGSCIGMFVGGILGTFAFPGLGTAAGVALGGALGGAIGGVLYGVFGPRLAPQVAAQNPHDYGVRTAEMVGDSKYGLGSILSIIPKVGPALAGLTGAIAAGIGFARERSHAKALQKEQIDNPDKKVEDKVHSVPWSQRAATGAMIGWGIGFAIGFWFGPIGIAVGSGVGGIIGFTVGILADKDTRAKIKAFPGKLKDKIFNKTQAQDSDDSENSPKNQNKNSNTEFSSKSMSDGEAPLDLPLNDEASIKNKHSDKNSSSSPYLAEPKSVANAISSQSHTNNVLEPPSPESKKDAVVAKNTESEVDLDTLMNSRDFGSNYKLVKSQPFGSNYKVKPQQKSSRHYSPSSNPNSFLNPLRQNPRQGSPVVSKLGKGAPPVNSATSRVVAQK